MSNYIFVEQMKDEKDILTVAVLMNDDEMSKLIANEKINKNASAILKGAISWDEVGNDIQNFISIFIADLGDGPIKNKFNHTIYDAPIERQLDQSQQSLEDFAINDLISGIDDGQYKVFIRGNYDKLYTKKKVVFGKNEDRGSIGFILSNFLLWSESKNKTHELIRKAYKEELDEFQNFITKYPNLGAHHTTGKRIIEAIQDMSPTNISNTIYFRAREATDSKVFIHEDLEAPKSKYVTKEGRYNHIGIPVLYLASDKNTCVAEMMEKNESKLLWFQKFLLNSVQVLDLTTKPGESLSPKHSLLIAALIYEGVINQESVRDKVWKPEYYIPRFVADVAKMVCKFDGIKFSSNRGQGNNLALFNWRGKYTFDAYPEVDVYTRRDLFNPNTPPWQKDLYSMNCPKCHNQISELMRICNKCWNPNPFYMMDDDI
ncbi:RES domain-containing protein [Bacillus sp. B15-48]|uniref:RES domain-containing protein n=1 Tax=Bacillus sp. B15-48 TaxID=1548601 RepID=UPI00193FF2A1|nr:RES domain-containing protein [Bacillus sp. B15-48]MBM4764691.1 RES domain-containing protein [Bacillus sp. B15-48]